jgi:hypothetical protein
MGKQFLSIIEPLIPAVQAERIAAIVALKQRSGQLQTNEETQLEIQRLLTFIRDSGSFVPTFQERVPLDGRDIMEGEEINARMEELHFDLETLYGVTNQLTGSTIGTQKILKSRMEGLRGQICRIADDILGFQRLKGSENFTRVITQGFADGRNASISGTRAEVDPQSRSLRLPEIKRTRHHQNRGVTPASVTVTNLSAGLSGVSSRTFEPSNAIDPDTESFWADVLLTEAPIQTSYTFLDSTVQVFTGALVEVTLVMGASQFVTDVKVLPFGQYPVDVVDIKIKQGDQQFQYPGYVDREASLNWLEWRGPRIQADEVTFVLNQPTYLHRRYHIPRRALELANFWEQLLDEEAALTLEDGVLTEFQQARAEADTRFASLHEALRRYGVEFERLDVPQPDAVGRTISETETLSLEVEATTRAMLGEPNEPALKLRPLNNPDETADPELVEIERFEYLFGAREIQANDADHLPEAHYASPQYRPDSTLLQIQIDPIEEHASFTDSSGDYRKTSIEYDAEIAPGRRVPLLPKGLTVVQNELLVLDRTTRSDTTRFGASSTTVTIRKNGDVVPATNYTIEQLTDGRLRATIDNLAFTKNARYSITYSPTSGSDVFDIESEFDSVSLSRPEVFDRTTDQGFVELAYFPFVLFDVVNNEDDFRREATRSARWGWIGGRKQTLLDGQMFSDVNTTLDGAITAAATTISLTSAVSVQSTDLPAQLKIGTEVVQYTGVSSNDLTGVTRGVDGTTAQAHIDGTPIVGQRFYEPLIVTVGSLKAFNITNYLTGKHPAFLSRQDNSLRYEFLHIGNKLFFNRPIVDKPITVQYRWMSQYIQVFSTLRSHTVGRVPYTPILQRYFLETESTVL